MATKKTSKKAPVKATAKKTAAAKTETKTTVKRVVTESAAAKSKSKRAKLGSALPSNLINIVIAEIIGTFILTLTALFASDVLSSMYVGFALMLIVTAIGGISGAHVNPAVTFGLWSMRKLKTALVPFYWGAQFLGAMAAVVLIGSITNNGFALSFNQFTAFSWSVFAVELIGVAVFMFGVAAALNRKEISTTGKAVGIGLALMIGLVVSGSITSFVRASVIAKIQDNQVAAQSENSERPYPREIYISGATLNPAVALAVTEKTDTQVRSNSPFPAKNEKNYSRFSLEVIVATLIGAALGGNLFLLINYRNKEEE
ncbi:MIP/aquaporin family protein [Candidatus Nanosynbacter featherlites]|jgi:major intrinsic protein|uniref:Aquaporin n=1 Tax=Candidatus Nanosynbacter featherlites TaxID=2572088 RepID=A0A4P9A3J1_9BACT|nr:aquaporin [Candidatus Nanosynbacter featherlites]QCT42362.1 hypothetical protein FBF37_02690 [Candidatus Nanosynbacter featherlites]